MTTIATTQALGNPKVVNSNQREKLVNQIADTNIDFSTAIRNPFRLNFILIYFHPRCDTHRSQDRERDSNLIFAKQKKAVG